MYGDFKGRIVLGADMSKYTSVRAGASCTLLLPQCEKDIAEALIHSPCRVIGAGSKILFANSATVIRINKPFFSPRIEGTRAVFSGGHSLAAAALLCAGQGLGGLEMLAGIPATVGGAVVMNAGAFGGQISDTLEAVEVLSVCDGRAVKQTLSADECGFGYRRSVFSGGGMVVLSATFRLKRQSQAQLKSVVLANKRTRLATQPSEPSCGSAFKRGKDYFAGRVIEECGLKGARIGGAEVSTKHANFLINCGGARADDFVKLLQHVEQTVLKKTGIILEREIIVV